jgi:hypothetical protein
MDPTTCKQPPIKNFSLKMVMISCRRRRRRSRRLSAADLFFETANEELKNLKKFEEASWDGDQQVLYNLIFWTPSLKPPVWRRVPFGKNWPELHQVSVLM